jgi:predicted flap endonuclease-1-like 5' DNA nuclease
VAKKISEIEGIGEATAKKLAEAGVTTVEGLLEKGADKKGREELAKATGIDGKKMLAFVNMADLFRIKGVGSQYAELMQAAGVNTVVELSKRKPENLHVKMLEVNAEKNLVRQPPSDKTVAEWVAQAKELPRVVQY